MERPAPTRLRRAARRAGAGLLALAVGATEAAAGADAEAQDSRVDFTLAGELIYFGYRELDPAGDELSEAYGPLAGIRLTARGERDAVFARLDMSLHGGEVAYDGETRGGRSVRSSADTRLFGVGARIGRWLDPAERTWGGFARVARRLWAHDIEARGGLFEEYRWSEVGLGVRRAWPAVRDQHWRHAVTASAFAVVDGTVFVELSEVSGVDWDDTTLELDDAPGLRLRYTAERGLSGQQRLRLELYYAYWAFGRSETERVTSNGQPTGTTVTRPRGESQRAGLVIGVVF